MIDDAIDDHHEFKTSFAGSHLLPPRQHHGRGTQPWLGWCTASLPDGPVDSISAAATIHWGGVAVGIGVLERVQQATAQLQY
jgi:hypothetical protein